jgi:TRAP-type C4-dicarboxylate transport system substrate-binding protein
MTKTLSAAAIAATALALGQVQAEPVPLRFSWAGTPTSNMMVHGIAPWAERVTKDSNGGVDIKVFPGSTLGSLQVIYDRTINGAIDIAFITVGPIVTNFPKSTVLTLPLEVNSSLEGSLAMWRLHQRGVIADEYAAIKPLAMFTFANLSLHSKKPIRTLEDLRGMKIGANSRITAQGVDKLGAVPVTMLTPEFYQAAERGTLEALHTGWPAVVTFKLYEVTRAHVEEPLGAELALHGMNKAAFAKLPAAAQAAIDKHSGLGFSETMGKAVELEEKAGRDSVVSRGHEMIKLAAPEQARWKQRIEPLIQEWVAATPNGAAVLAAARDEIGKIRAGR